MRLLLYLFVLSSLFYHIVQGQGARNIRINEHFDKTPLSGVIRILKNKYQVKMAYDDALVTGITVSGRYRNISLIAFLDRVFSERGIGYQLLNGKVILLPGRTDADPDTPVPLNLTVHGLVIDAKTGETLPNALIRVAGSTHGTVTNKNGYFSLTKVPSDTSIIEVSYLGYNRHHTQLKPGDIQNTLRISLQENAFDLKEVTIENQLDQTIRYGDEISQISINPNDVSALPSLGELDVFRSLQLLPGISGTNETSSGLAVRSSPSSQNLVLFDGFSIYRLDHFFGVFSAINSDAVRDIQVYKGGFGARYGGRVSGVVDITGKTGNFNEPSYALGLNLLSTRMSANLPVDKGKGAIHISGRRAYTDIIRSNLFEKLYESYRENSNQLESQNLNLDKIELRPDFHFYDLNVKSTYNLSKRDVISLSFYRGRDNLRASFDRIVRDNNNNNLGTDALEETATWGNNGLGFTWSRAWSKNYYSSIQIARSDHFFNNFFFRESRDTNNGRINSYELNRDNEISDLQLNFRNEWTVSSKHALDFGFNFSGLRTFNDVLINDQPFNGFEDPTQKGFVLALYGSDTHDISDKLSLTAGFRLNITNLTSSAYIGHRLGLAYQPTKALQFKLSSGSYHQFSRQVIYDDPKSNNQDSWNLADDDFYIPMTADHLIAGFNYKKKNFLVDVEYFRKNTKRLLEFTVSHIFENLTDGTSPELTISEGSGTVRGLDVLVQKSQGPYQGWIAYTLSKAENQFDYINEGVTIPSRQDQRHELKIAHILSLKRWNLSAVWIYGSGKPFYRPEIHFVRNNSGHIIAYEILNQRKTIERLPSYSRIDLSVAYKFGGKKSSGEIGVSLLNVFNRTNIHSRRLTINQIERMIFNDEDIGSLYQDLVLLDFTPSVFLNINF